MSTKPTVLCLRGKNAENFSKAIKKSGENVLNYKEVQKNSLHVLRELSNSLRTKR